MRQPSPSSPNVSARMSRQVNRDTGAERAVRQLLHASGYRYRIHYPVPGMPRRKIDIAFPGPKLAVLIDGCFWHGCPEHATSPKANAEWWRSKLDKNMTRDRETSLHLQAEGWTVLRFWEHERPEVVAEAIARVREAARSAKKEPRSDSRLHGRH